MALLPYALQQNGEVNKPGSAHEARTGQPVLMRWRLSPCAPRRLNLAEGCFLAPLQSGSPGVNACALCPATGLFAAAGEGGLLECFDLRQRRCAGALDAAAAAGAVGGPFLSAYQVD